MYGAEKKGEREISRMRIDKKKATAPFALTLLIMSLLLLSLNGYMGATEPSEPVKRGSSGTSVLGSSLYPIVTTDPTEIEIPFCETGDIAICVENFTGLTGFQFKIWWLKDIVNYTGYEWKPYPPEWLMPLPMGPDFEENATHKAVVFAIVDLMSRPFSYSGRWPFIDTYWHCLRPGVDSPLIFDRAFTMLVDDTGTPIPIGTIIDGLIINPLVETIDVELYPRRVKDLGDPTGYQWHELHPSKTNFYHLKSWEPGRVLSPEDQIDMYAIDPPVKIYLECWEPVDLSTPICTTWHEFMPMSQDWHLSSWKDTNGDGYLSPCDQIDMTNERTGDVVWFHVQEIIPPEPLPPQPRQMILDVKYWFQVDEVTVDMWLSPYPLPGPRIFVEYKCGYWTFDPTNPICTKWNQIDPGMGPVRCLHLTSLEDNGDGKLSPSDIIDMTPLYPNSGPVEYYHVDWMSISLKLSPKPSPPVVPPPPTFGPVYIESAMSYDEFNLSDPVCTKWFEIYPVYGTIWHLSSWEDNLGLSPSDQIVLQLKDPVTHEPIPCTDVEYHVDKVTVAMNLTMEEWPYEMHIVKFEGSLKQFKQYHWTWPISTQWHEVNPDYCRQWHILDWTDTNENLMLDYCDLILMIDKETGWTEWFHVESLSTDMWLTKKPPPPPEDLELYPRYVWYPEDPTFTQWHELHPSKSNFYQIMSWEPGMVLGPCDTVVMDGMEWFEVNEVTIDIVVRDQFDILHWLDYKCGYWVFKKDVWRNPVSSKWNEIKPEPMLCWHLADWDDNGDGKLSPCDNIIMELMYPYGPGIMMCHVEQVTVTMDLLSMLDFTRRYLEFMGTLEEFQDMDLIHNPRGTPWHEIWPEQGRPWILTDWFDGFMFSPSDQIVLAPKDPVTHEPIPCKAKEYHVDKLTVAMNLTSMEEPFETHIVKFEGSLKQFMKFHWYYWFIPEIWTGPWGTQWHEVNPDYCRQWHILDWTDTNENLMLDYCDLILMIDKETGWVEVFHVESLSTDIWVTQKICGVDITNVTMSHCGSLVNTGYPLWTIQVNVTVHNNGTIPINCTVNAYCYNATTTVLIGTQPITNLDPCNTITLTFNWPLLGLRICTSYTVKANATCLCGASDQFIDGSMKVKKIGDVDNSNYVNWVDLGMLGIAYETGPGNPNYNPEADFDDTKYVNWVDQGMLGLTYETGC